MFSLLNKAVYFLFVAFILTNTYSAKSYASPTSNNFLVAINYANIDATASNTVPQNVPLQESNGTQGADKAFTYRFGPLAENLAQMQRDKVIASYYFTLFLFRVTGLEKNIKQGIYTFRQTDSLPVIMKRLRNGEEDTHLITIPEGFDIYDIDARLLSLNLISQRGQFVVLCQTHPRLAELNALFGLSGKQAFPTLEGFLPPESYRVRGSRASLELVELATLRFLSQMFPFLKNEVDRSKWKDVMTIASLVEKETIVESERPLVSSVVYNRLAKKMKLRYDPTIIYAMKKEGIYTDNLVDGNVNIRRSHFLLPNPFNTYYRKGLPPGPITSPSLASLQAAANPATTDYLFFVAKSKKDHLKGHYFSKTYDQHLAKIKLYRSQ